MKYEESYIQQSCVTWFRYQYPQYAQVLIHPANEGRRDLKMVRTKYGLRTVCTSAQRLKAEGVTPGTADLLLLVPRGPFGSLAIEMKTEKGKLSDHQSEWGYHYTMAGNLYKVCRSLEDFMSVVNDYLSMSDSH